MNPFSPPPGPYPNNYGPQAGFLFPTNDRPPAGMPFGPNDHPPAGMPFRTNDGPPAGMQYPTYYGAMPGMRGPTVPPLPVPPPAAKKRMILPVLGGGFVGAVVLAALIALQGPDRFPAPGQAESALATNPVSALDLQPGDCYDTGQLPPAPGTSTPISTVEAVPCASPHTDQVIAKVVYSPTDTLADVRANRAATDCEGELRQKVAPATLTDPGYSSGTLVPATDTTWTAGRTIACVVMADGPRTGSVLK
ncbi:MAG TPA: hypothetical protein VFY38_14435 [Pseudonocardia sp.]|nr:hypothetical protein [Pseudonocardia sp.]